jgi:myo-inositol 2-dehydrogenase / D-chiro-inositol 1-dehydrogenase
MTASISIGLLGAGRIGKVHAAAIAATPRIHLTAVADAFAEPAAELASAHNADVRTIDEIMASGNIDAVFITTPTDVHADLIEQAARAGKAIFCEKPIDLDVRRVRDCLAVVAETRAVLMIGFNRRFDPNFKSVRDHITAGAIGEVEMVSIVSRDPGPPPLSYMARSGGLFRDMTIHDFDMARFLLGEEPVSVSAVGSVLVDPEIATVPDIDSAAITLVTASGQLAQISNSRRAAYGYDQRIEVLGSTGLAKAENIH